MYQYAQDTIMNNTNSLKETVERTLNGEDSMEILKSVIKSVDEIAQATKNGLTTLEATPNLYIKDNTEVKDIIKEYE